MKILDSQCDEVSLAHLGAEAAALLARSEYRELADRFGYALAFDKACAEAIQADVDASLLEGGFFAPLASPGQPDISVRYFKPKDVPFIALVECRLALAGQSGALLAELIITEKDGERSVTLEQISRTI